MRSLFYKLIFVLGFIFTRSAKQNENCKGDTFQEHSHYRPGLQVLHGEYPVLFPLLKIAVSS